MSCLMRQWGNIQFAAIDYKAVKYFPIFLYCRFCVYANMQWQPPGGILIIDHPLMPGLSSIAPCRSVPCSKDSCPGLRIKLFHHLELSWPQSGMNENTLMKAKHSLQACLY